MERKTRSKNSQPPAPQQAPWLVFFHGKGQKTQTFFSVSDGTRTSRNIPEMRKTYCSASYFGWLVMESTTSEDIFLLHAVSLQTIQLPYSKLLRSLHWCIFSSPPTDPDCVVIFYGSCDSDSFIYWRPGANQWYERKYKTEEMQESIRSIVSCNGKLYSEGSSGRLGIIDVAANPPVTWLEKVFPDWPGSECAWCSYLVESFGDIFFVLTGHFLYVPRMTHFSVYKFDFERMALNKVSTLGDRVLFLSSKGSTSCSASISGMKKDCIYFTMSEDKSLYVFHLDLGTISVHLPCPKLCSPWQSGFWIGAPLMDSS